MFCGCPTSFGAEPNTQVCPVCLGAAGSRCRWSTRRAVEYGDPDRAGPATARSPSASPVRTARTTSIRTCPRTTRSPSTTSRCQRRRLAATCTSRRPAIGITRAHLEEDTGKIPPRRRPAGRIHGADALAGRLQPGRGSRCSRSSPSPTSARPRRPGQYADGAAGGAAGPRGLRRQDGGRLDARRRQRVGPAGRARRVRHQVRDQEPQLAAASPAGPSTTRSERQRGSTGRRRRASSRRPATGTRTPGAPEPMRRKEDADDYRYFPEPDLVPIEATAEWVDGLRAELARAAGPSGEARPGRGRPARPAKEVSWLVPRPRGTRLLPDRPRRPRAGSRAGRRFRGGWVMGAPARDLRSSRRTMAANPVEPERLGELLDLLAAGTVSATAAKDVLAEMFSSRRRRPPSSSARAWPRSPTSAELEAVVERVVAANPDLGRQVPGRQAGRARGHWSARSCARPAAGPTPSWSATSTGASHQAADRAVHRNRRRTTPTIGRTTLLTP